MCMDLATNKPVHRLATASPVSAMALKVRGIHITVLVKNGTRVPCLRGRESQWKSWLSSWVSLIETSKRHPPDYSTSPFPTAEKSG
jgi:hypothetical protein